MGYNSRASSVVVSGTPVRRPSGQMKAKTDDAPHFGVCRQLDFELETALVIGKPNVQGCPISLAEVEEHAFGVVLLNDWSARDIQQWEAQPLGVFNSKNFATSISPWIVTLAALEPFRVAGPEQDPAPLPYLRQSGKYNIDAHLEASIWPEGAAKPSMICRTQLKTIYWSFAQQLVHQTSAGCNVLPGDLLGSGTVTSSAPGSLACLFEITRDGKQCFELEQGGSRMYLEDGDQVILTGWCQGDGYRVGFGECEGRILPAWR
jgi:fumarylacetoacetase